MDPSFPQMLTTHPTQTGTSWPFQQFRLDFHRRRSTSLAYFDQAETSTNSWECHIFSTELVSYQISEPNGRVKGEQILDVPPLGWLVNWNSPLHWLPVGGFLGNKQHDPANRQIFCHDLAFWREFSLFWQVVLDLNGQNYINSTTSDN